MNIPLFNVFSFVNMYHHLEQFFAMCETVFSYCLFLKKNTCILLYNSKRATFSVTLE